MTGYRYKRWSFLILVVCLATPVFVDIGDRDRKTVQTGKNDAIVVDLGPVYSFRSKKLQAEGLFKNDTGKKLRILGNQVSCGCMIVNIDKQALMPDETLKVTIQTEVPVTLADRSLIATLKTDSLDKAEIIFDIRFTAVPRLHSDTGAINFGSMTEETYGDTERALVVRRHQLPDEKDQSEISVKSSSGDLVCIVEKQPDTDSTFRTICNEWVVKVIRKEVAKKRIGLRSELVEISLESGEVIRVPVNWTSVSSSTLIPRVVDFGTVSRGKTSSVRRVMIDSLPGHFKRVQSIFTDDCILFTGVESEDSKQFWEFRLDSTKSRIDGYQSGKLVFVFGDGSSLEGCWIGSITSGL